MHCSTTSRCTKSPVSPSSVISAQPADKWAVNRINSGHMYSPVFNYLAVNLAKEVRVTAQHSSSSLPLCFSAAPCFSALTSLPHCSSSQTLGPTVRRSNHICIRTRWWMAWSTWCSNWSMWRSNWLRATFTASHRFHGVHSHCGISFGTLGIKLLTFWLVHAEFLRLVQMNSSSTFYRETVCI